MRPYRFLSRPLTAAALSALAVLPAAVPAVADSGTPPAFTIEDPRIRESSGLAASRVHPGVYWTHNDSDDGPYVYAVDSRTGRTVARVTLAGITPRDVEAISIGPDGNVYVGDIGDNLGGSWPQVWIYRFPEPKTLKDTTVTPVRYTVRYEDGPRDAESLMVHPKTGRVYLVSKKRSGKGALYAGPENLSASGTNTFRRVADINVWATDGAFSPDGTRLVVRGYFNAREYRWENGLPKEIGSPGVPFQGQGESVTFTPDGRTLMYGSEGKRSSVQPIALEGELLPEQAAKAPDDSKGGGPAAPESEGGGDRNRNLFVGAAVLAAAVVLVTGLRKLVRRK
ncbi:hypothetical protein ACFQ2B_12265 [Streptomyces stramineus]|uniref:WD40 repeat domain-containing protein n=1 Tax=Streptomyces stramineus TaxID=173861 RepID=A0ABN1AG15_9ACTN